jgi:hypothetical protein
VRIAYHPCTAGLAALREMISLAHSPTLRLLVGALGHARIRLMSAVPFDSHAAVKRLTAFGFDETQAEALVKILAAGRLKLASLVS